MTFANRIEQLEATMGHFGYFETAIYVGAKVWKKDRTPTGLPFLYEHAREVECWEAWEPNVVALSEKNWFSRVRPVFLDQRVSREALPPDVFLFWWHGPEHLHFSDAIATCARLIQLGNPVVLACPWGSRPQGAVGGNPFEEHRCALCPEDFSRLGYTVSTYGASGVKGSNILAWRTA